MKHRSTQFAPLAAFALLAGCATAPNSGSLDFDPFERENRGVHEVNRQVDRAVFGPVARGWGETVPQPVRNGIANLRHNWKLPGETIQYGLQGDGVAVARNTTRFLVNTTLGLGGLLDPAVEMGLPYRRTGFDETFHVWGIPDGGYVELPIGGPGTQRDWTSWGLDIVADPLYWIAPVAASNALLGINTLDIVNDRYELDPVLEELLYASQDSYTAQRISYLQNKRARLEGGAEIEDLEDIYADF